MSILVYTENWDGKFKKLSFELVSYANALSKMLNTSVTAISIGNVEDDELNLDYMVQQKCYLLLIVVY